MQLLQNLQRLRLTGKTIKLSILILMSLSLLATA